MEKIKIDFGTIIAVLQKESGQTQRVFAERVGISPSTLINIFNGLTVPSVLVAYRLCMCLGVKLDKVCRLAARNLTVESIDELKYLLAEQEKEEYPREIARWRKRIADYDKIHGARAR